MTKKRIYFFNINFYMDGYVFLPYVYGTMRSYCDQIPEIIDNYEWMNPIYEMEDPETMLSKIIDPNVVAFSSYVWNHRKNLYFSRKIKEMYPNCLVVFGGPHIPNNAEDTLKNSPWIDLVVHSEGEIAFEKILKQRLVDNDFSDVPNTSYMIDEKYYKNTKIERLNKIIDVPSPYLRGYYDDIIKKAKETNKKITAFWETNRGCPYSCAFCDWGNGLIGGKYRQHSDDRVFSEVDWFAKNKIDDVHNTDSNFGIFPRDLELTKKITGHNLESGYPRLFAATYAKNSNERVFEISKLVHNSKMSYGTTLSVQSMSMNVLEAIARDNIGVDRYMELKRWYHKERIPTYSEVILGLPRETHQSLREGFAALMNAGLHDNIMLHLCSLLPNAPMAEPHYMKLHGIKAVSRPMWATLKWEQGEMQEHMDMVVGTNTMPSQDWVESVAYGFMITIYHGGGLTRFLARYLNDECGISYLDFYSKLFDMYKDNTNSVLGDCIKKCREEYTDLIQNPKKNYYAYSKFNIKYNDKEYEISGGPYNYFWLYTSLHADKLFEEISELLKTLNLNSNDKISELLNYQKDRILSVNYDPEQGKVCEYNFNWYDYFYNNEELKYKPNIIKYSDVFMGMHFDKKLIKGDLISFRWSSQAHNGARPRHYLHQEDCMELKYV